MTKFNHFRQFFFMLVNGILAMLSSFLKISYIIGSKAAFFSLSNFFEPLIGISISPWSSLLYITARTIVTITTHGLTSWFLVYHIPLFSALGYFQALKYHYQRLYALVPLLCMLFFVIHPIGSPVFFYSFFWLIPIFSLLCSHNFFFLHALGSTLTAHGLGTIIWLYMFPTTSAFWIALLPIVVIERLLFALSMTVIHRLSLSNKNCLIRILSARTVRA